MKKLYCYECKDLVCEVAKEKVQPGMIVMCGKCANRKRLEDFPERFDEILEKVGV